jgi:hypothetical protein
MIKTKKRVILFTLKDFLVDLVLITALGIGAGLVIWYAISNGIVIPTLSGL